MQPVCLYHKNVSWRELHGRMHGALRPAGSSKGNIQANNVQEDTVRSRMADYRCGICGGIGYPAGPDWASIKKERNT